MQSLAVSFDDSIASGTFGPFSLGDSRDRIGQLLGKPTDAAIVDRKRTACIWRYGLIEFHFGSDVLTLIHCDAHDPFCGGPTLNITSRKFRFRMSRQEAEAILSGRELKYTVSTEVDSPECHILLESGYSFGFVLDADAGLGPTGLRSWTLRNVG